MKRSSVVCFILLMFLLKLDDFPRKTPIFYIVPLCIIDLTSQIIEAEWKSIIKYVIIFIKYTK